MQAFCLRRHFGREQNEAASGTVYSLEVIFFLWFPLVALWGEPQCLSMAARGQGYDSSRVA